MNAYAHSAETAASGRRPTLEVEGLSTHFSTPAGAVKAVDGVGFSLQPGRILGLVGESGSGKTVLANTLMGLVAPPGRIVAGSIRLEGEELRRLAPAALRALRGARMAMIFQDPMAALNPVLRIGTQMVEAIHAHRRVRRADANSLAHAALVRVGIAAPAQRLRAYPHQLSGGMRQRVAIAIALLNDPALIIADEPTTALDVTLQSQILYEMQRCVAERNAALLWITHDLSVVAGFADEVCVMYAGRIVEQGSVAEILSAPLHPYTRGLIGALPAGKARGEPLQPIPGMTPSLLELPAGCAFRNRCARASPACSQDPPETAPRPGCRVRCHHPLSEVPAR